MISARKYLPRGLFLVTVLLLTLLCSCGRQTSVVYKDGLKETDTHIYYPRRSTSYTKKGKTVYTDSVTGVRVKVLKYKTKNGCWQYAQRKRVEITYDSTGKRTGRENILRQQRKEDRRKYNCDTCRYTRRKVRAYW